jgi:hypothetical protein
MPIEVTQLKPNLEKLSPSSKKYDPLYSEIYEKFAALTGETSVRITKNLEDKNFYLGEHTEHWETGKELTDIHPVVNYCAAVINKYADLLTAGEIPGLQVVSPDETIPNKANAAGAENLVYRILDVNFFAKKMHYGAVNGSMLGDTFYHLYWDPDKVVGGKKGSPVISSVSPFFIRVGFARDNWDDIEYWIGESKMTPSAIKRKYDIDVPGTAVVSTGPSGGSSKNAPFDDTPVETDKTNIEMATVLEYHDTEKDALLIGDQAIFVKKNNGNHGLYHIRNRTAPNEPWGYPDHYNIKDPNINLNRLHGQAQMIVDSHAAPIIVDKGNVLGNTKIKKRHNVVVTTQPYLPGEGLEYLQWNGNIFPVDKLIDQETKVIHDLSEMPAAAFGSFQPGEMSGFALTIQMQPTLMRIKIKQNAEWGPNLIEMYRYLLKLVLENDKTVELPKEVADFDIKIHWPNPLPREDAREIQNQVALITNELTSRETARQELIIEDVVEEGKKIDKEKLKRADVEAQMQAKMLKVQMDAQMQAQQQAGQVEGQGETALNRPIKPGEAPEQAFPTFPEEERPTPQNLNLEGGESISPTSVE